MTETKALPDEYLDRLVEAYDKGVVDGFKKLPGDEPTDANEAGMYRRGYTKGQTAKRMQSQQKGPK